MRLMFLSASGQLGGAETSLLEILASLRQAEPSWPLHLLVAAEGPLAARAASLGVGVVSLPFPPSIARLGESGAAASGGWGRFAARLLASAPDMASYLGRVRATIAEARPDILHTNGLKMHLLGAHAGMPPLVWHLHDYLGARPLSARLLRLSRRRCAVAIANSASVAADARRVLGDVPIVAIHNGVDLQRFSPTGATLDLDALAGMAPPPPATIRVGLVGTFARWKGHETFLRALARLPHDVPVRGYVIGDAVYDTQASQYTRQELLQLVHDLQLGDRVAFTGFVARPEEALRALDVVVHASTEPEPFGLVIAEAMACARPVVVSGAGGAAEIVHDGVDAAAHRPGDVEGLAARIATLALDAGLRARLASAGRSTATRAFDRTRLATGLMPIYRHAAAARG